MRIILVEDDVRTASFITKGLKQAGFAVDHAPDGEKVEGILDYGFSKEKRFDLKQVIVGVLMTRDGIPIGHEVYPGNTNDINAFREMIRSVAMRFKIRRVKESPDAQRIQ